MVCEHIFIVYAQPAAGQRRREIFSFHNFTKAVIYKIAFYIAVIKISAEIKRSVIPLLLQRKVDAVYFPVFIPLRDDGGDGHCRVSAQDSTHTEVGCPAAGIKLSKKDALCSQRVKKRCRAFSTGQAANHIRRPAFKY